MCMRKYRKYRQIKEKLVFPPAYLCGFAGFHSLDFRLTAIAFKFHIIPSFPFPPSFPLWSLILQDHNTHFFNFSDYVNSHLQSTPKRNGSPGGANTN